MNVGRPFSTDHTQNPPPRGLGEWQQTQVSAALSEITNKNVRED